MQYLTREIVTNYISEVIALVAKKLDIKTDDKTQDALKNDIKNIIGDKLDIFIESYWKYFIFLEQRNFNIAIEDNEAFAVRQNNRDTTRSDLINCLNCLDSDPLVKKLNEMKELEAASESNDRQSVTGSHGVDD